MQYQIDDEVLIVEKHDDRIFWPPNMDKFIGQVGVIRGKPVGIEIYDVRVDGELWCFQSESLAKANDSVEDIYL